MECLCWTKTTCKFELTLSVQLQIHRSVQRNTHDAHKYHNKTACWLKNFFCGSKVFSKLSGFSQNYPRQWLIDSPEGNNLFNFVFMEMSMFHVIYQTVFHRISKHRVESWKYDAQRSIFNELRGVWKCDETPSGVFDVSSQSKLKLRRKRRNKSVKIYANEDQISKRRHGHDFLCLNLLNY
jgi:hypothetical protein